MNPTTLSARIATLSRREAVESAERDRLRDELAAAREAQDRATAAATMADGARSALQALAELKRQEASAKIEGLVTSALRGIFGRDDYEFKFKWDEKRGVATAEPTLTSTHLGETIEADILDGHGGGIKDVIAFVLRFLVVRFTPGVAQIIIVDEPFRQVASVFAEGLGAFLKTLTERSGVRLVFVTHSDKLVDAADRVYHFTLENGRSVITEKVR